MARMDDSELDDWFGEEKDRLEEELFAVLTENKAGSASDRAKERFDKRYRALIATYQSRQRAIYEQHRRSVALHAPVDRIRERTKVLVEGVGIWWDGKRQELRKWRFDRKIRRILRDKSDL